MAEVATFEQYCPELRDVVNPSDITALLFSKHLITKTEKAKIDDLNFSVFERMDHLLPAVQRAIEACKNNFHIFLEVLGTIPRNEDLVKCMRTALAGKVSSI